MRRLAGFILIVGILIIGAWIYLTQPFESMGGDQVASDTTGEQQANEDTSLPPLPPSFAFSRLQVDTNSDAPEACLAFTADLDDSGDVDYETYLSISPRLKPSLRVAGPLLCLGGLEFNQTYQVTIREGMPSASGMQTTFDELVPVELRDRPPAVAFAGGVILPRESGGEVPITTINVDTLSIRVLRVGDRLLAQLRQGLLDETELYSYDSNTLEEEQSSLIWSGEMDVEGRPNQSVITRFPIAEVIEDEAPGAYLVLAENATEAQTSDYNYWRGQAAQWVIETDLALTSYSGADGIHLFARSYEDAAPRRGVRVDLVARNNDILGTATTDGDGAVHFGAGLTRGTGGDTPVMLMTYGPGGDFASLDLRRAAFDLSDRGVSGRSVPGPIDAFLYTDRGIYRPGETVQLVALMRDASANALDDLPLTFVVTRPDGVEFLRETVSDQDEGAAHFPITLSRSARHGSWRAAVYVDTSAPAVGSIRFEVQDFVPERLEVTATPTVEVLRPGDDVVIDVTARFLYGAPAVNMTGEAELRLSRDSSAFEDYADYSFGRVEDAFSSQFWPLNMGVTDAEGNGQAIGNLSGLPTTTWPLRGNVRVAVYEPGGRATSVVTDLQIRTNPEYIGIRSAFEGRYVRQGAEAAFDVVAVSDEGVRLTRPGASWRIVREVTNYQWYEVDGQWRYERITIDRPISAGEIDLGSDDPARVSDELPWGTYRLIVADAAGNTSASVRFYVGWWGASSPDRPDTLVVTAGTGPFERGGEAQVTIRPEHAGPATVVIANSGVIETRLVDVPADGMTLSFDVTEEWGAGAYALVTQYRGLEGLNPQEPARAVGLTWLEVDHEARVLEVTLDVPEVVAPQQQITVPVQVTGLEGQTGYLTLAAVDQGILQLTGFEPPNPEDYYFGKQRLGVEVRDDYGRLIRSNEGVPGTIRTGGDAAFGGEGLTVVPTRTVALFSGLVELDVEGRANVTLDIPDFAGELRLMAVAVSETKVGQTDTRLTVRDALVGELSLPRFLAPGDQALATLSMHNVSGEGGVYSARITASDGVSVGTGAEVSMSLPTGRREEQSVQLTATELGVVTLTLELEGPGGFARQRTWPIQVRAAQLPQTLEDVAVLTARERYDLPADVASTLIQSTAEVSLNVSSTRGLSTADLLRGLSLYPFGCLEQTVSRAFPLLYFDELADRLTTETQEPRQIRIQNAVDRVLDMQRSNGAFGMWGYQGAEAEAWLSLYALDFLSEADRAGFLVPDDALRRGRAWTANIAEQSWRDAQARAYAFYVLARAGEVVPGDLRYFHDMNQAQMTDVMSLALLGAALDNIGDRSRGAASFDHAVRLAQSADPREYTSYVYGSLTRDVAGAIAMAAQGQRTTLLPALFERLDQLAPRLRYTTTQEKAWLTFAAHALASSGAELDVTFAGVMDVSGDDPATALPTLEEVASGVSVVNNGSSIWRTATTTGIPAEPLPAEAAGLVATRTFHALDGSLVDLADVQQNDRIIVLIEGRMADNYYREMAVLDLLPAGFEIESTLYSGAYSWLPSLSGTQIQEARDDRYVAAFNIGNRYRPLQPDSQGNPIRPRFAVAYMARAITPGAFVLPAFYVEDMYQPRVYARGQMGEVVVTAE